MQTAAFVSIMIMMPFQASVVKIDEGKGQATEQSATHDPREN
jgi:hypothetical protein